MRALGSLLLAAAQLRSVLGLVLCAVVGPAAAPEHQSCEETSPPPAAEAPALHGASGSHDAPSNVPCAFDSACAPVTVASPLSAERLVAPAPERAPSLLAAQLVPDREPLAPPTPPPNS